MNATITWIDARHANPPEGYPVLAAATGRYSTDDGQPPSPAQDFWLVIPMHFEHVHVVEGTDQIVRDCYLDIDGVVRKPLGAGSAEQVTHWAALPPLPGTSATLLQGATVAPAITAATSSA